jgi:hypothetical protein
MPASAVFAAMMCGAIAVGEAKGVFAAALAIGLLVRLAARMQRGT